MVQVATMSGLQEIGIMIAFVGFMGLWCARSNGGAFFSTLLALVGLGMLVGCK